MEAEVLDYLREQFSRVHEKLDRLLGMGDVNGRLDRVELRLDRIEKRLDLHDEA